MPTPLSSLSEVQSNDLIFTQITDDIVRGKNYQDSFYAKVHYDTRIVSIEYTTIVSGMSCTMYLHIKEENGKCYYMGELMSFTGMKAYAIATVIYTKAFCEAPFFNFDLVERAYFPELAFGF